MTEDSERLSRLGAQAATAPSGITADAFRGFQYENSHQMFQLLQMIGIVLCEIRDNAARMRR